MTYIIFEICKKELKNRLGSKTSVMPLIFTFLFPLIAFLPQLHEFLSSPSHETRFISLIFFLIIPVLISNTMGINSFINEIRWKTIKTLLVTPIDTKEIFIGKSLACVLTGIIADVLLAIFLIIWGIQINMSILFLFFGIGPLTVIYTTFILIIGSLKFPKIAETGGGFYFPIVGLILLSMFLLTIDFLFAATMYIKEILSVLIIGSLVMVLYFTAKRMFNKEKLILSW